MQATIITDIDHDKLITITNQHYVFVTSPCMLTSIYTITQSCSYARVNYSQDLIFNSSDLVLMFLWPIKCDITKWNLSKFFANLILQNTYLKIDIGKFEHFRCCRQHIPPQLQNTTDNNSAMLKQQNQSTFQFPNRCYTDYTNKIESGCFTKNFIFKEKKGIENEQYSSASFLLQQLFWVKIRE